MRSFFRVVFLFLYKMPGSPLFDHAKWIYFYNTNLYYGTAIELNDVNRNHTLLCVYNTHAERARCFSFFRGSPWGNRIRTTLTRKIYSLPTLALMCRMQRGNFFSGAFGYRKRDSIKVWYMDAPREQERAREIVNVCACVFVPIILPRSVSLVFWPIFYLGYWNQECAIGFESWV